MSLSLLIDFSLLSAYCMLNWYLFKNDYTSFTELELGIGVSHHQMAASFV